MKRDLIAVATIALLSACSDSSNTNFNDVVGIPPSDGAGDALSGTFTVRFEVTSSGCDEFPSLNAPSDGAISTMDVEVEQDDGSITFDGIEAFLEGGISFQGEYEVGGADLLDRGGYENNILRTVFVHGKFQDADTFDGKGEEQLEGRIASEEFNCSFSFEVSGIRK